MSQLIQLDELGFIVLLEIDEGLNYFDKLTLFFTASLGIVSKYIKNDSSIWYNEHQFINKIAVCTCIIYLFHELNDWSSYIVLQISVNVYQ